MGLPLVEKLALTVLGLRASKADVPGSDNRQGVCICWMVCIPCKCTLYTSTGAETLAWCELIPSTSTIYIIWSRSMRISGRGPRWTVLRVFFSSNKGCGGLWLYGFSGKIHFMKHIPTFVVYLVLSKASFLRQRYDDHASVTWSRTFIHLNSDRCTHV